MVYKREILIIILLAALLAGVWFLISGLSNTSDKGQTQFVHDAVHNAMLTCYAVEGAYPDSLDYLRENYGLAYDDSRYIVSYNSFASNIMPDIHVIEVEADA